MGMQGEDGQRVVRRVWTWAFVVLTVGLWFLELSAIGFSKPEHNDGDPVSAAGYNHQQNLAWADHVFWICAAPLLGAVLGALLAGPRPEPGVRALSASAGAFLIPLAVGAVLIVVAAHNVRFVF
jgi:hypothetical protein